MWQGLGFRDLPPIYLPSNGQAEVKNKSLMISITTGQVGSGVVRLRQVLSVPFLLFASIISRVGCPESAFVGGTFEAVGVAFWDSEHQVDRLINAANKVASVLCIDYTQQLVAAMASENYSAGCNILQLLQLDGITSPQSVALILWYYDIRTESSVEMMDCKFMMCQR